jgi:hypothetical protein
MKNSKPRSGARALGLFLLLLTHGPEADVWVIA